MLIRKIQSVRMLKEKNVNTLLMIMSLQYIIYNNIKDKKNPKNKKNGFQY